MNEESEKVTHGDLCLRSIALIHNSLYDAVNGSLKKLGNLASKTRVNLNNFRQTPSLAYPAIFSCPNLMSHVASLSRLVPNLTY